MITCAISAMMGTMAIMSYDQYVYRSRVAVIEAQGSEIELNIDIESEMDGWFSMATLTGSGCTACAYYNVTPSPTDPYLTAQWASLGQTPMPIDPWGTPLVFDENEGEKSDTDCRADMILSAGPNRVVDTWGPSNYVNSPIGFQAQGDDIGYYFKRQRMPLCNGQLDVF